MVSKLRLERISDRIRDDLAEMLLQEVSDPRLEGIYITGVKVDRELAYADIYVSALEGSERAGEVINGLEHAQGYLRRGLSQRIALRTFPRLRFHWDPTAEKAARIEELLASLHLESTPMEERRINLDDESQANQDNEEELDAEGENENAVGDDINGAGDYENGSGDYKNGAE